MTQIKHQQRKIDRDHHCSECSKLIWDWKNTGFCGKCSKAVIKGKTYEEIHGIEKAKDIKERLSEIHTGRKNTVETIQKMKEAAQKRIGRDGTTMLPPARKKSSETKKRLFKEGKLEPWNKGQIGVYSEIILKKMSDSHKNQSDLTKKLISIAHKKLYQKGKSHIVQYQFKKGHKTWIKGKKTPEETKRKISYTRIKRGVSKLEKNPAWLGGKSFEPYLPEFNNQLKNSIRAHYHNRCQQCFRHQDELKKKLSIPHIDFDKKNNDRANLIPLCNSCHNQTNFKRNEWVGYFQQIKQKESVIL